MAPAQAREALRALGLDHGPDFHAISSDKVRNMLGVADFYKYRKPRNANGSRARYFYAYLQRQARREVHQ